MEWRGVDTRHPDRDLVRGTESYPRAAPIHGAHGATAVCRQSAGAVDHPAPATRVAGAP